MPRRAAQVTTRRVLRQLTSSVGYYGTGTLAQPYPKTTLPAAGGTFTDPTFGSTIIRVTDAVNAPTGVTPMSDGEDLVWNYDGTMFILNIVGDGCHLFSFNRTTYALTNNGRLNSTCLFDGAQWHPTDPAILFASDTARSIYKYTGLPTNPGQTPTLVHDFSAQIPGTGAASSRVGLSDAARYVALCATSITGGGQDLYDYVSVWDTQTSSVARTCHVSAKLGVPEYVATDIVTNGTATVTSASSTYGTDVIGNEIILSGGTGSLGDFYNITARPDTHTLTVALSAGGSFPPTGTGATGRIGVYLHSFDYVPGDTYVRLQCESVKWAAVFWNWVADTVSDSIQPNATDNFAGHKGFGTNSCINPAAAGVGDDTWLTRSLATPHSYTTLLTYPQTASTHTFLWDSHGSRILPDGAWSEDPQYQYGPTPYTWVLHSGSIWKVTAYSTHTPSPPASVIPPDTCWYGTTATPQTLVGGIPSGAGQFWYDSSGDILYLWLTDSSNPNSAAYLAVFPWIPILNEIVLNRINTGTWRTQRLCHHRALLQSGQFYSSPLAKPDRQSRFVLFGSNWNDNAANVDAFIVDGGTG